MKSILFSLYQHFWTLSLGDAISDTFTAMRGLVRALLTPAGDATLIADLRLACCQSCPFYDKKWKTCGTPGETMATGSNDVNISSWRKLKIGCWCYLPLANRDPKKDCYARANDLHSPDGSLVGWPDVLRPVKQ